MKPYVAIAALAIVAGASAYVLDGLMVAMNVLAIALLVPGLFLAGYRHWLSSPKK